MNNTITHSKDSVFNSTSHPANLKIRKGRFSYTIKSPVTDFYKSIFIIFIIALISINSTKAATFEVNNNGDTAGSATVRTLRYCITQANANPGADIITFTGLGAGTHTITLTSSLPDITGQVSIQGYAATSAVQGQLGPSSSRSIRIQINGNDITTHMFAFIAGSDGSSISGLAMYNTKGICIFTPADISGLHIWGNYFGLLANGTTGATSADTRLEASAIFVGSTAGARTISNLVIGTNGDGTNDANEGNVIANTFRDAVVGGTVNGIYFYGDVGLTLNNSKVSGNYFGILPDGATVSAIGQNVPGPEGHPISFIGTVGTNVVVGTDANGTSDALERNIISGSTNYGIQIESGSGINIAGNYIGTDYTGTVAKPNSTRDGFYPAINIQQRAGLFASNNIAIGFDDRIHTAIDAPLVRNIISGNAGRAVTIGTLAGATLATRTNNIIVAGNYIGVDATGNVALPNGTFSTALTFSTGAGVTLNSVTGCRVGTNSNGVGDLEERNIISGNLNGAGVYLASNNFTVSNNTVAGNYIGVGANGTTALGNGNSGVYINSNGNGANNNTIGSDDNGTRDDIEANIIANNGYKSGATIRGGVMITNSSAVAANASNNNRISRNVFYNNTGLPIDLASWNGTANVFGVSLNDGATTANQPNLLLDYPVITGYSITSATTLDVSGYISICNGNESTAGANIGGNKTIQFYKVADDGDQNGAVTGGVCTRVTSHGEGIQYLGSITSVVNAFTNQTLTLVSGATFSSGDKLVAIAIDATGNTSEFGATVVVADLAVTKTVSNSTAGVGSNVTFTITASNLGPDPATSVIVNDVLPSGYTLVSATPSVGTWTAPNWTIGNLAVGGTATLTIIATVRAGGAYANTATISGISTQIDPVSANNSATATVNPDTDGDGIPDATDLDDDNDGILDTAECGGGTLFTSTFPTTGGNTDTVPGWTVGGTYNGVWGSGTGRVNLNANGLEFRRDASTVTTLSRNVTGVFGVTSINLNNLYWFRTTQGNSTGGFTFTVSYGGTVYATISSTTVNNTTSPVVAGNNGGTTNLSVLPLVTSNSTKSANSNLIITLPSGVPTTGELLFTFTANSDGSQVRDLGMASVSISSCNDTDGDGIPNYLDLDSDNDGCPDAVEGGASFTSTDLVNSSMPGGNTGATSGTFNQPVTQNLGNTVDTNSSSASYGVPTIAGAGQAVGTSATANPVVNAGIASSNQTITSGSTPATLNLTGATGNIQWQVSTNNTAFTDISGANTATYAPGTLTATRYYRAIVTSAGGCTAISNVVAIGVINCTSGTDSDGDGIADICDVDDDNDGILDTVECPSYNPSSTIIVQSTSGISSFNVNTLVSTPVCTGNLSQTTDIAISTSGVMYGVYNSTSGVGSTLAIYNQSNCTVSPVRTFSFFTNSLSFLPDGNLLVGGGNGLSTVYKIDVVGGTYAATVWRNFGSGQANGDFIYINGKVYVLWFDSAISTTNPFIKEVTVDANYNYVSETNLGTIQPFAFGLAKANGDELYAATANSSGGGQGTIIKINYKGVFSWNVISTFPQQLYGATSIEEGTKECDTDNDGIPDRLDLDSDGDGCSDAKEGGADIANSQLVTATGTLGGGSTSVNQNLCALTTCVSTTGSNIGLPQLSTLPTGYSNTTGQTVGDSQNALVNSCVCYEDPALVAGATYPVKHGITILGRAGADNGNWPMLRNSAYTALEGKTKGLVITRNNSPETTIAIPVVGMMVFDTDENAGAGCLKIYTGSGAGEGWKCFSAQGCP
ncbi:MULTISPECIES: DUF11 domain-containing protein [Chryseobacterium]|uniref:Conserved repeat domain n=1 Tax=Chryseobacterium taihuense TaxID=1141221 RepID=A0A4U8WF46_9FLAO|nr:MULTISPECIES: DUF11 domain-containing protein [Chryseobacterium]QQV02428.1 DUF11 domain-containing protein [Chryseobacterium sp. FDAARGOS 1104]VFB04316.1 conserved repeat domain [Chryseobacterium taihuense]